MRYVLGTGWWCDEDNGTKGRYAHGDAGITTSDFFELWKVAVLAYCDPVRVVVVDSASPIPPSIPSDNNRFVIIQLPFNAGHSATGHTGRFCGWTRSVLLSLQYAIASDAEYFVYIEQDTLIHGHGIIEHCIDAMRCPYMFGDPGVTRHAIQQSFFIIRCDGFDRFLASLLRLKVPDAVLSPEDKFALACSKWLRWLPPKLWTARRNRFSRLLTYLSIYDLLPVGYGRSRPIDFSQSYYYFQRGSEDEIKRYLDLHPRFPSPVSS